VEYIDGIFSAHKLLQDAGYKIFWVTLQNCIKEGKITEQAVHDILIKMVADFKRMDIYIDAYRICQSKEENDESKAQSKCEAIQKLAMVYSIDLSKSIGIGDRRGDIEAYDLAGVGKTIQALLPFGDKLNPNAGYFYEENLVAEIWKILHEHQFGGYFPPTINTKLCRKVEKVWGAEYWLVNSKEGNYCSKILELKEGHRSSRHYHNNKHETFVVLSGIVHIGLHDSVIKAIAGDRIEIETKAEHWFESKYGVAYILEVSTYHDDDDCVRLEVSS
jgi:histidinol phosphatase-like enzyme/mannose-6-phosphate isomerase-like protein (cupin superfamily)